MAFQGTPLAYPYNVLAELLNIRHCRKVEDISWGRQKNVSKCQQGDSFALSHYSNSAGYGGHAVEDGAQQGHSAHSEQYVVHTL